ncbi:MAG: class I SAM-dependent methyltransferase [Steroidobacteraceae bacterium]|jgi:SAM-dependent methyltransferase
MTRLIVDRSTDIAWEEWGRRDPYFGVITNPVYRLSAMSDLTKAEFFESGRWHVNHVMESIRRYIDPDFQADAILDFGCGVGRTLVAFSPIAKEVVGLDVSRSMLSEANINCSERGLTNVRLLASDDALSALEAPFNLIHSSIVFQHIQLARGRLIFQRLLALLASRGVGAIHLLYGKSQYASTHGVSPFANPGIPARPGPAVDGADPEIQMNPYNLNEIMFLMQTAGVQRCHVEFTDHGGELGVFLFFQKN